MQMVYYGDDDDDGVMWMCRNVKFECKRPCYVSDPTSKSSSSSHSNIINTSTTAAAAAAGCLSHVKHHRRVVGSQPVGPVCCRSTPGLTVTLSLTLNFDLLLSHL